MPLPALDPLPILTLYWTGSARCEGRPIQGRHQDPETLAETPFRAPDGMNAMISATSSAVNLGLVVELLDYQFGLSMGDVIWQLGGHDAWLDERDPDIGQQLLPQGL